MEIFYFFFSNFFPLLIVALIIYLIVRANRKARSVIEMSATQPPSAVSTQPSALSEFTHSLASGGATKEGVISQIFLLISIGLLGLLLLFLNYYFNKPIGGGVIGFIVIAVALGAAYYFRLLVLASISLIAMFFWWGFQGTHWAQLGYSHLAVVIAGFLMLSCLYLALGYAHRESRIYKRLATVYLTFGAIGLTGLLIFISTQTGLDYVFSSFDIPTGMHGVRLTEAAALPAWQIFVSMAVAAVVFIVAIVRSFFKRSVSKVELISLVAFAALAVGMLFISGDSHVRIYFTDNLLYGSSGSSGYSEGAFTTAGRVWAILLNLALILEALVFLFMGYMRQKASWVNLAVGVLFVILFVKYIDWFYSSLDKEYFFIGAGVLLLLIGGAMEKSRRYMIEHMKNT